MAAARGGSGVCGRLILEITESAAMATWPDRGLHEPRAGNRLRLRARRLRRRRDRVPHFRDFRFDIVKIDGAFIEGVHAARDAQVLVECLTAVARHFEMLTVAERVECEADAAWLRGLGVDCLQGYLSATRRRWRSCPPAAQAETRKAG